MTRSKVWKKLRWVLPAVLIITGGFLVSGGIYRLVGVPDWSEYDVTAEFPKGVSHTDIMACLDGIPEIARVKTLAVRITEVGDNRKLIAFRPAPGFTKEIKSALEKRFTAKILDEFTDSGPSDHSPLGWLEFTLAFLVWPLLLFLAAWQLIKFYRSSA